MRQLSAERIHTRTNAEATITENAATVAEQGAHVAPEKDSSKKAKATKTGCSTVPLGGHPPMQRRGAADTDVEAGSRKGAFPHRAAKKTVRRGGRWLWRGFGRGRPVWGG